MIEIVCKDRLQEEEGKVCLPKNIRQIGSPRGRHKIYIEDYVYTYLKNMAQKKESCAVIFLGESQVMKDIRYTFISGAIECGAGVFQWDSICLDDSFWTYIEEERKQYFSEKEIVGWFLGKTGQAMELTSVVEAAHRKYFSGRDKVLMLMDILEEEEAFFIYDQGYLQKREGYYIYYEKNLPMQEYMVQKRGESFQTEGMQQSEETKPAEAKDSQQPEPEIETEERPEELAAEEQQEETGISERQEQQDQFKELHKELERETVAENQEKIFAKSHLEEPKTQAEEALESYRHMILERQGRQIERQNRKFLYTASSFFLVVICVLGITTINNYRKMQEVEDVLYVMNSKESQKKRSEDEEGPVVESVMSQVDPMEETKETTSTVEEEQQETKETTSSVEEEQQETSGELPSSEKAEEDMDKSQEDLKGAGEDADKPEESSQETTEASAGQSQEARYYTVKPGDTLGSICISIYHNQRMMEKICEANGIENGDKIYVGQRLLLP